MTKTNAMRLLDAAGISYSSREYEYDESDLSGHHAAQVLGIPAEQVFKTLSIYRLRIRTRLKPTSKAKSITFKLVVEI